MKKFVRNALANYAKKVQTKQHDLLYLFWECTTRCNLSCLHCGSDCKQDSSLPDMPAQDFLKALDTIKNPSKNFIVVFTGGEPLLRKDIDYVGREIRKRGMRWSMVSNGMLYTKERQQKLLQAGMGALTISLDGLEDSHNWMRNVANSYTQVANAISIAASCSRLNFDVVSCVTQKNLNQLEEMYCLLLQKGVKAWRLFNIVPIGRAKNYKELFLDKQQFTQLMDFISLKRKDGFMDIKFSCEGYVGQYEYKVRESAYFCRAGINIASVLIDGSISACPNCDRSFSQGNIYTDNLADVWDNKYEVFRDRTWVNNTSCSQCSELKNCQGNGMHNWHGDKQQPLVCHYKKTIKM